MNEIEIANKTCRTNGAVGRNAIVPRIVRGILRNSQPLRVLDYGAGIHAIHAKEIASEFPYCKIDAYEFGANRNKNHIGLGGKYDLVYASNVINVQSNKNMLVKTLHEIKESAKDGGLIIFNYPQSPRKMKLKTSEIAEIVGDVFGEFEVKNLVFTIIKKTA